MTKENPALGVNAQSFANHLTAGIEAAGLDVDSFRPMHVQHIDGRTGFSICQLKPGRTNKSIDAALSTMIACFEDGIEFMDDDFSDHTFPINELQPPSMLAVLFLAAILTKKPLTIYCEHCAKEKTNA
tara:strand:+ start:2600 stop:2983 length:384 start_codon:yes stop_codon:yes gene_type:complete